MNQQKSLFNIPPHPAPAAHESPTSCQAAVHMTRTGKHASIQARVLEVLRLHPDGLTDEEIATFVTGCRFTSIVSARNSLCGEIWTRPLLNCSGVIVSELIRPALVENSGLRRKSPTSGCRVSVWRVK